MFPPGELSATSMAVVLQVQQVREGIANIADGVTGNRKPRKVCPSGHANCSLQVAFLQDALIACIS